MALKAAVSTARPVEEDTEVPASIPRHGRDGRPKIRHADNPTKMSYWPRASSFAERVEETYTLDRHNERLVVRGMSISPDLCDLAQVLAGVEQRADKDELTRIAGLAKTAAGGDRKANSGTALHKLRERRDAGEDLAFVGPKMWAALQAYIALMENFSILGSEQFVVNDRWRTAGSYDIYGSPAPGFEMIAPDGEIFTEHDRLIGDLKSGAHIDELGRVERAVQQVIYAYGTPYEHVSDEAVERYRDNGRRWWCGEPADDEVAPSRTWSLIPHVPLESPEDAAWWWVDLTKAAMIADEVAHLHELRKIEGLIVPAEPPRPVAEPAPPRERIEVADPAPRNEQWRTCSDCNYDTHICQGCGEPVTHEQGRECAACRAEHEAAQAAEREAEQAAEREAEQTAPAPAEKPLTWGGLELERPVMPGAIEHLALLEAIQAAGSEDEIDDIWESNRGAWADAHTAAVRKRLAQLSHGSTEVRTP